MTIYLILIAVVLLTALALNCENYARLCRLGRRVDFYKSLIERATAKHEHTSDRGYERIINTKEMSSYYSCSIFPGYIFESVCTTCKCRYIDERILDSNSVRDTKLLKEFKKRGSKK